MTAPALTRRRVLQISAALPVAGLSSRALANAPSASWTGRALGSDAQMVIAGLAQSDASEMLMQIEAEILRLESIFSLYQNDSAIVRLNQTGVLHAPSPDLLNVLSLSRAVWKASGGAFDPSIQPLWDDPNKPHTGNFAEVSFDAQSVRLGMPGMALTFNGVAQGYITDKLADMMRRFGLRDVMINAGEIRTMGLNTAGNPWRVGLRANDGRIAKRLHLKDSALATSAPRGTLRANGAGHILDGRNKQEAGRWNIVSIQSQTAAVADALSTAACALNEKESERMLREFPSAKIILRN